MLPPHHSQGLYRVTKTDDIDANGRKTWNKPYTKLIIFTCLGDVHRIQFSLPYRKRLLEEATRDTKQVHHCEKKNKSKYKHSLSVHLSISRGKLALDKICARGRGSLRELQDSLFSIMVKFLNYGLFNNPVNPGGK